MVRKFMQTSTIAFIGVLAFLVPGIAGLLWPEKIQEFALKYYANHPTLVRLNPFLDWMKTKSYIISLRIVGVLSIGAAALILFAMARGVEK